MLTIAFLKRAFKLYVMSFLLWAASSSLLSKGNPYSLNQDEIQKYGMVNSKIYFITAHPDDESMFFNPTLIELAKPEYQNSIELYCFSNGDYDGIGHVREKELSRVAAMFGIDKVHIGNYKDGEDWDSSSMVNTLRREVRPFSLFNPSKKVHLITFDNYGVSGHKNHISVNEAVRKFIKSKPYFNGWELVSESILVKYSSTILTNAKLILRVLAPSVSLENEVSIVSSLHDWFLSMATMTTGHYSQMVYFRWLWLFFSNYIQSNTLIRMDID